MERPQLAVGGGGGGAGGRGQLEAMVCAVAPPPLMQGLLGEFEQKKDRVNLL